MYFEIVLTIHMGVSSCLRVCVCMWAQSFRSPPRNQDVNYGALWAQTGNLRKLVLLSTIHQHMNQNNRWIVVRAIWESARVLCNQWTLIIPVKVCHSLCTSLILFIGYPSFFVFTFSLSSVCLFMSLFPLCHWRLLSSSRLAENIW